MIAQQIQSTTPRDKALVIFALLSAAWGGLATGVVPILGLLIVAMLATAAASPSFHRDARMIAWVSAGISLRLALHLPHIWPLAQILFVLPACVAMYRFEALRGARSWLTRGRLEWTPVIVMGGFSIIALLAWTIFLKPDLSQFSGLIPDYPLPLILLGAIFFSVVNAILEELAFRGILQGALESFFGPGVLAIVLQAILFGTTHFYGFPSGIVGAILAGTWALMLGWARTRTKGLLTPFLAHIAADMTIFTIIAWKL